MTLLEHFSIDSIVPSSEIKRAVLHATKFKNNKKQLAQVIVSDSRAIALKYNDKFLQKYNYKLKSITEKFSRILKHEENTEDENGYSNDELAREDICDLSLENISLAFAQSLVAKAIINWLLSVSNIRLPSVIVRRTIMAALNTVIFYQNNILCLLTIRDITGVFVGRTSGLSLVSKILKIASATLVALYKKGIVPESALLYILPIIRGCAELISGLRSSRRYNLFNCFFQ